MRAILTIIILIFIAWLLIMAFNIPLNLYRIAKEKNAKTEEDFTEMEENFNQKQKTTNREKGEIK